MNERQEYLIKFLRSCAEAAGAGQLGVEHDFLQINGDLMQEAADEFEKLLPKEEAFKSTTDELQFHLVRAEHHARQAHDLLYRRGGLAPKRSFWFKSAAGRAQSILMNLRMQELGRS